MHNGNSKPSDWQPQLLGRLFAARGFEKSYRRTDRVDTSSRRGHDPAVAAYAVVTGRPTAKKGKEKSCREVRATGALGPAREEANHDGIRELGGLAGPR